MAEEQRKKTRQINFRLPPELAERFESHCESSGIAMTQFFENAVRQALGEPLTIPPEILGVDSQRVATGENNRIEELIEAKLAPIQERLKALETPQRGKQKRVA